MLLAALADVPSAARAVAGSIPMMVMTASRPDRVRFQLDLMLRERDFNMNAFPPLFILSIEKGLHETVQPLG